MERKKITFDSFIRGVILGVIIIGILMLFKRLSGVLLPFCIAWLIAYLSGYRPPSYSKNWRPRQLKSASYPHFLFFFSFL